MKLYSYIYESLEARAGFLFFFLWLLLIRVEINLLFPILTYINSIKNHQSLGIVCDRLRSVEVSLWFSALQCSFEFFPLNIMNFSWINVNDMWNARVNRFLPIWFNGNWINTNKLKFYSIYWRKSSSAVKDRSRRIHIWDQFMYYICWLQRKGAFGCSYYIYFPQFTLVSYHIDNCFSLLINS